MPIETLPIRHRTLAERADELAAVLDDAGSAMLAVAGDGTVVLANARATELFRQCFSGGFDPEATRYDVAELLAPLEVLLTSQAADERRRPTLEVTHEGVSRLFGYAIQRARRSGPPLYVIVFSDVTRLRQLEEERDRLLKLATVGEVMPMLLHETKNPLSAAVTMLELLLEEREEPTLREDLHAVLVEIRRAVLTLDGLGAAARSMRSSRCQAVDHAVREVCSLLDARARRHGVQLICDVDDVPLLPLDAPSVRGVVLNLVTNAIHACQNGGCTVLVRLRVVDGVLQLDVIDGGTGMNAEVLARCGELFFTTKRNGSGIGMALCRRLVEDAGGTLGIESRLGAGTHVVIRIPVLETIPATLPATGLGA